MNEFNETLHQEGTQLQSELASAFTRHYAALAEGSAPNALLSDAEFLQGSASGGEDRLLWKQDTVLEQEITALVADLYACIQLNPEALAVLKRLDAAQAEAFEARFGRDMAASQAAAVRDILRTISRGMAANQPLRAIAGQLRSTVQRRIAAIEKLLASLCRQANEIVLLWKYKQDGHTSWQFITEQENCEACGALGGQVFAISEAELGVNLPPLHPNCDCCVGVLDDDGKIVALIGSSEDGFDLLSLPENMARTPSGRLACRFEAADSSLIGGVPLVLWVGERTAPGTQADLPQDSYLVTAQQLIDLGWSGVGVSTEMVAALNEALVEFDITTPNRIRHFLAQCTKETKYGQSFSEQWSFGMTDVQYFTARYWSDERTRNVLGNMKPNDAQLFRGAGGIHLTGRYNYQEFANYVGDQSIMTYGYELVKTPKYAWRAAGFFWEVLNGHHINERIDKGASVNDVTDIVNIGADSDDREERKTFYEKMESIFPE